MSTSFKIVNILRPILMIVFATLCKQFCKNDINVQHKVSTTKKKYTCRSLISNKKDICLTWRREPSPSALWRNFLPHRKLCWHSPVNKQIQFHILFIVRNKIIWICIVVIVSLNHLLIEHSTNDKGSQVSDLLLLLVHPLANSHRFSVEKFGRAEPIVEEINHCPDQVDVDDYEGNVLKIKGEIYEHSQS